MRSLKIMRGIPGSGKSTKAREMIGDRKSPQALIVSADDYFINIGEGVYKFVPALLGEAHASCMKKFLHAVYVEESDLVIVDNTNTRVEEIAPYYSVGKALRYDVEIIQVDCEPTIAAARNSHGVPLDKVLQMYDRMNRARLPWKVTKL